MGRHGNRGRGNDRGQAPITPFPTPGAPAAATRFEVGTTTSPVIPGLGNGYTGPPPGLTFNASALAALGTGPISSGASAFPAATTPQPSGIPGASASPTAALDEIRELEALLLSKRRLQGLDPDAKPELTLATTSSLLRLDLGCGKSHGAHATKAPGCKLCEGFEGVDIMDLPGIKYPKTNLWKFPWPFADDSVDEIHASHFVEHIPMTYWNPDGTYSDVPASHESQDLLFKFFDECYRIMKHDALMTVVVPACQSTRAFQDPTHRRFIPQEQFLYLNRDWRKMQQLDHYGVKCHFGVNTGHSTPGDEALYHAEAGARRFRHYWNVVWDHIAQLKAAKK